MKPGFSAMIAVLLVCLSSSGARAQPMRTGLGAWSVGRGEGGAWESGSSHAWALLDDGLTEGSAFTLMHLPPRRRAGAGDGVVRGSIDGSVRVAARVAAAPEALVAHGASVLLIYAPRSDRPDQRSVVSLTAAPSGIADLWRYVPEGRMEVRPSLPSRGRLMGQADSVAGPAVLIDEGTGSAPEPRLWVLSRGAWRELSFSPGVARSVARVGAGVFDGSRLIATGRGLAIAGGGVEGGLGLWVVSDEELSRAVGGGTPPPMAAEYGALESLGGALLPRTAALESGGLLTLVDRAEVGVMRVRQLTAGGGVRDLARVSGVPGHASFVGLEGGERIAAVWREAGGDGASGDFGLLRGAGPSGRVLVVEVSGLTGRELYRGPGVQETAISAGRFRTVVVAVLMVVGVVLLMVLRQPEADAVVLPKGTALAEPGRRIMASAVDTALAVGLSMGAWGMSVGDLLSASAWIAGPAVQMVLTAAGVGLVGGTLLEGWAGRTPGKLLLGCEVVRVAASGEPGARRPPGIRRALVRNLVKWVAPPAALVGLMDPSGGGAGGLLGGTRVVVRVVEEAGR